MRLMNVRLRDVVDDDVPLFFTFHADPDSARMAGVPLREHEAFMQHWVRIRADENTMIRTILADDRVAGYVLSFVRHGAREVGYWIDRAFWGRGIATDALRAFLAIDRSRPLCARIAKHNAGSLRVATRCGFVVTGEDLQLPEVDPEQIEEFILTLAGEETAHVGRLVIAMYAPKPGKEESLLAAVRKHYGVLRAEHLVTERIPYVMRAENGTILEVFEWASPAAIERAHGNAAVRALWEEFGDACEYTTLADLPEKDTMFPEFAPVAL